MDTVQALYAQNPFWLWMSVGGVLVAMDIATGAGRFLWGAAAAAALAFFNLAGAHMGLATEIAGFIIAGLGGAVIGATPWRPARSAVTADSAGVAYEERAPMAFSFFRRREEVPTAEADIFNYDPADRNERLVGRIGRTTSEFNNGVGRVWIDGAEWGAELCSGDDNLTPNAPVRVTAVVGGIRLLVMPLTR